MANHKSSEKRARSSETKRARNRQYISAVRTSVKKVRAAVDAILSGAEKDPSGAWTALREAQSILAKAATRGVMKKNTVSRTTGRLTQALKKATGTKK